MDTLKKLLAGKGTLVTDGATGTQLAARGLPDGVVPEVWDLERPDDVRAVAASYVEAGSDVILTNTFGATRFKLAHSGLEKRVLDVNRAAAKAAKEAAGGKALVFASVGPTGGMIEPLGDLAEADVISAFAEQARGLVEGGVDGFCIESFSDLAEAKAALKGIREASTLPVVVSLTFSKGARGYATLMGVSPEQAARELEAAGADAVGANCGIGSAQGVEIAQLMRPATKLPLWIKPNAGLPQLVDGKTIFPESPEEFVKNALRIAKAGVAFVGGCCGTTPAHIRLFSQKLRA